MIGRVVEIQQDGRHLSLSRGFMVVSEGKDELTRIPLDDIAVLIAHAHQLTYTHALLLELNKRGIAFVACGSNHLPAAIFWPVDSHHQQAGIMNAQIEATQPLQKNIWKQVIRAKILFQYEVIQKAGIQGDALLEMARRVKSGDPDNLEAQAARRYWPLLMGKDFTRNRDAAGINSILNYGYAIIRSGIARAIMAAGLHPTLGIFHRNRQNPMCLADDLMEPFRPHIDWQVWKLIQELESDLTPDIKRQLALTLLQDCTCENQATPLSVAMLRTTQSLAKCFLENNPRLFSLPDQLLSAPRQVSWGIDTA